MRLFHISGIENLKSIKEHGLIARKNPNKRTKLLSICLEEYKPERFPPFVSFDKCVWLTPYNNAYEMKHVCNQEDDCFITVNSKDLDKSKIYVGPSSVAQQIAELLEENYFRSENREASLTKMVNSSLFKNSCRKYWEKFIPFNLYLARWGNKNIFDRNLWVEVLYFDDIPASKLIVYTRHCV